MHTRHAGKMVVLTLVLGLGVGSVASLALSDEGRALVDAADRHARVPPSEESERRALAARAGIHVEDLLAKASGPEGMTREEFEASERLRAESVDPATLRAVSAALRQRLEWAAQYADGQRLAAASQAVMASAAAGRVTALPVASRSVGDPIAADVETCRPFCELLRRCNGPEEPGDWAGCLAACGRGEFGMAMRLRSVVALGECGHL